MSGELASFRQAVGRNCPPLDASAFGYSTLEMTSDYVHLLSPDVARVQERVSPLERIGQTPQGSGCSTIGNGIAAPTRAAVQLASLT